MGNAPGSNESGTERRLKVTVAGEFVLDRIWYDDEAVESMGPTSLAVEGAREDPFLMLKEMGGLSALILSAEVVEVDV